MAKTDYTTWIDYCARTTESVPDSAFNEVATGCRDDDEKFLNAILENPTNFILVPTKERGHLACVHHCSVHDMVNFTSSTGKNWIHQKIVQCQ